MISQAEITRAYYTGEDVMVLYRRRYFTALTTLGIVAAPIILVTLYLIKSALGINLMADMHAWELFL